MTIETWTTLAQTHVLPLALNVVAALAIFFVGRWIASILMVWLGKALDHAGMDPILREFVVSLVNGALLLFIVIAALDQMGVNTSSMIALLGAAGLAVGLAMQSSLQNFAAGIMLLIFRPFRAGDFVDVAGVSGTIEKIGIFSTTMKTGDNKELIIPNGKIYGDIIINYSARPTRRVDMVFGIGYDDDLRKARAVLQDLLARDERVLAEPAPLVAVSELADSSVNLVVRPWVNAADYWAFRFDFLEAVKLAFDAEGISIPYPQMDVHLNESEKA
jgi:small conductance mechanosensitive channel